MLQALRSLAISMIAVILLSGMAAVAQTVSPTDLFPKSIGGYRAFGASTRSTFENEFSAAEFGIQGSGEATYRSTNGESFVVAVLKTETQAGAYALLTEMSARAKRENIELRQLSDVGIAGFTSPNRVVFYKGSSLITITGQGARADGDRLTYFARQYAGTILDSANDIPVLVKHLPEWETAQDRVTYAVSLEGLRRAVGDQAVLDVISFDEGAEAVSAGYDGSMLVVVEFRTPQIAENNDARILGKIKVLSEGGQPVPSAYRRVGNYSVFVFNAPNETAAAQLIDQVKYEQKIQWLGENPFAKKWAEEVHTQKAVSLILGIAKTIGLFIGLCLSAGALVGGLAYLHRRAQRRAAEAAYSDAGGMLRLNLDEITPETDPARLLAPPNGKSAT